MTPVSVAETIKRPVINDPTLLNYQKHHEVELTLQSKDVALEMMYHPRLIELFPTRELRISLHIETCLCDLHHGQETMTIHVNDDCPQFPCYISSIGLIPGTHLTVLKHSPFHDNLKLRIAEQVASIA